MALGGVRSLNPEGPSGERTTLRWIFTGRDLRIAPPGVVGNVTLYRFMTPGKKLRGGPFNE